MFTVYVHNNYTIAQRKSNLILKLSIHYHFRQRYGIDMIRYDTFVNCNWVYTRWQ